MIITSITPAKCKDCRFCRHYLTKTFATKYVCKNPNSHKNEQIIKTTDLACGKIEQ